MTLYADRTYEDVFDDIKLAHPDKLKGHWKMDEASGNLTDSSGNGHTMAANGNPVYEDGPIRRGPLAESIDFDGTGDEFNTSDHADFNFGQAMTVVAIINRASNDKTVVSHDGGSSDRAWNLNDVVSKVRFIGSTDGSTMVSAIGATTTTIGQNHVYVGTYDGTTLRCYLDGVLDGSAALSGNLFNAAGDVRIGNRVTSPVPWVGNISDVSLWNAVLTPQEIAELSTACLRHLDGSYEGEVAKWDAEYGAAVYYALLEDPSELVDVIANDSITINGGPSAVPGSVGTASQFGIGGDGVDDHIDLGVATAANPASDTTFYHSLWFKGDLTANRHVASARGGGNGDGFVVYNPTDLKMIIHGTTGSTTLTVTGKSATNVEWHFIAYGYRSSDRAIFLYIDGEIATGSLVNPYKASDIGVQLKTNDVVTVFSPQSHSRYRCYSRYPATGELDAIFAAGRTFIDNIDTDSNNNPDWSSIGSFLSTAYAPITAAENYTVHGQLDYEYTYNTVSTNKLLDAASANGNESASLRPGLRVPYANQHANGEALPTTGTIKWTGTQQSLAGTDYMLELVGIDFGVLEGFTFIVDDGSSGHVYRNSAANAQLIGCRIIHDGDDPDASTELNLIDSLGASDTLDLVNCLVEIDTDDQPGGGPSIYPSVAKGSGTVDYTNSVVVNHGSASNINGIPTTGSIYNATLSGFRDLTTPAGTSVYQAGIQIDVPGGLGDVFDDPTLGDYTAKYGGIARRTGTLVVGNYDDAFGTTWDPIGPNASHFAGLGVESAGGSGSVPLDLSLVNRTLWIRSRVSRI